MPRLFDLLPENTRKELTKNNPKKVEQQKKFKDNRDYQQKPNPAPHFQKESPFHHAIIDFVAIDVETTGLDFKSDRVIEIGAVRFVRGKPAGEFTTFVNAGVPVPPHITDLTSITDQDLAQAPSFSEICHRLIDFIGNLPLCGHQIEFDYTFLNEECKRLGREFPPLQLLDTALLSRVLLQTSERFSLKFVSENLDIKLDLAHRALHDARASGYVAVALIPKIYELPIEIRQTMAACAPSSLFKNMIIRSLGRSRPYVTLGSTVKLQDYPELGLNQSSKPLDTSILKENFQKYCNSAKEKFHNTDINSIEKVVLSTGSSLDKGDVFVGELENNHARIISYLIPSSLYAIHNNTRVLIAVRSHALQEQIRTELVPTVSGALNSNLKCTVLKPRNNYLCKQNWLQFLLGRMGNFSPRERNAILPLIPWAENSETGDIEDQNYFNHKWFSKVWATISASSVSCKRESCEFYSECFYYQAKKRALGSHLVIIHHPYFFSHICSTKTLFDPSTPIVFDEAHNLISCGYRNLRIEIDTNRINSYLEIMNDLVNRAGDFKSEKSIYERGKELRSHVKSFRKYALELLSSLDTWSLRQNQSTRKEFTVAYSSESMNNINEIGSYENSLTELADALHLLKQELMAFGEQEIVDYLIQQTNTCTSQTSQLRADSQYLLTANTENHVFWMEGNHEKGWIKLCGVAAHLGEELSRIWEKHRALMFMSQAITQKNEFTYFAHNNGIDKRDVTVTSALVTSPPKDDQLVFGVTENSPELTDQNYASYICELVSKLFVSTEKNIAVLFVNQELQTKVYDILKVNPTIDKKCLHVQGLQNKISPIPDKFKGTTKQLFLGNEHSWENFNKKETSYEILIITQLPFVNNTHPLSKAIEQTIGSHGQNAFESHALPEAVTKFRLGTSWLCHNVTEKSALIVLDNSIVKEEYGKEFSNSVGIDYKIWENIENCTNEIVKFLGK